MKRISLVLLCGLLFSALAVAQTGSSNQSGSGAREVRIDGASGSSKTMVISTKSGEDIEITVTNLPSSEPPPSSSSERESGTATGSYEYDYEYDYDYDYEYDPDAENQPVRITIYNYVTTPARTAPPSQPESPPPPAFDERMFIIQEPPRMVEPQPPVTLYEVPPAPAPVAQPSTAYHILPQRIIPGLPDPNNGRIYRLQVGSFSAQEAAAKLAQFVKGAGFNVTQERDGSYYRVIVPDIPAAMVQSTAQRLGAIGIGEIWVRQGY